MIYYFVILKSRFERVRHDKHGGFSVRINLVSHWVIPNENFLPARPSRLFIFFTFKIFSLGFYQ